MENNIDSMEDSQKYQIFLYDNVPFPNKSVVPKAINRLHTLDLLRNVSN